MQHLYVHYIQPNCIAQACIIKLLIFPLKLLCENLWLCGWHAQQEKALFMTALESPQMLPSRCKYLLQRSYGCSPSIATTSVANSLWRSKNYRESYSQCFFTAVKHECHNKIENTMPISTCFCNKGRCRWGSYTAILRLP